MRYTERMLQTNTERLLPILIYIQTHLEDHLSLESLAEQAGLSPFHFHRLFRATIGETVKQYVQRLRLEQAAFQLKIRHAAIIDIAFNLGYQSHETFTRAFRKHFGTTPTAFRQTQRVAPNWQETQMLAAATAPESLNQHTTHYDISRVSVQKLAAIPVAFIRHLGDYVDTDAAAFDTLIEWAQQHTYYTGENLLIGIGHDDPSITPIEKVRYDACIQLPQPIPPEPTGAPIGFQETPAGLYATATYVGPYGPTIYQAYAAIFQHVAGHALYSMVGLPALEIYRTSRINPDYALNQTDIFMPIIEGSTAKNHL